MTWQCDIGVILDMVSTIIMIRAETEGLGCDRVFVVEGCLSGAIRWLQERR